MTGPVRLRPHIAVAGGSSTSPEEDALAEAVGRAVAEGGGVVVCGGLGGAMEAACRGAKQAGGITVGILPGIDGTEANAYVDVVVPTGLGEARNALVVRSADALVAVAGEFGTLSEIALALRAGIPVVGLRTWELRRDGLEVDALVRADSPGEAAAAALALARAGHRSPRAR